MVSSSASSFDHCHHHIWRFASILSFLSLSFLEVSQADLLYHFNQNDRRLYHPASYTMSSPSLATGSMAQRQQINQRSPFSAGSDEKAASDDPLSRIHTARSNASSHRKRRWWKIRLFRGMIDDVKRRAPYYWSDWRDAWDYRVVPATVYMYFAKYGSIQCNLLKTTSFIPHTP